MSYSVDLRKRVVAALGEGMKKTEIAQVFKLGYRTVQRYEKLAEGESLEARVSPGRPRKIGVEGEAELKEQVDKYNDATLEEHRALLEATQGLHLSTSTVSRALKRLRLTRKKDLVGQ